MGYFVFSISFVREKKTEFYYYYYYFTYTYSQVMCLVAEKLRENKRKRDMGSWVFCAVVWPLKVGSFMKCLISFGVVN